MAAPDEDQRFIKPFISHKSAKSLAIPLAFNEYFPDPLPNTVELLDYYGRSWTIRMKKRGETVFLTVGWENFVKDNELEDGKMMEFIYDCDRTFYVVIFGHGGVSELRVFPQAVVDVGDYATGEEEGEEEEEEEEEKNKSN
ncbi:PREDICTED: B3 domain-containing protein At1g16640 [Brassica oleracea var. oleracea]|uniref:TF-B3 domain-containing protein n=1 Tax=Brassica oleracea var. oleracea TaxID=109376 RepID=A0A0D3CAU3_BRAOL|nr:PREDICTED: B3 domain-containing protein At1g16640 [Brassica oleracea var. oleracea]